MKRFFLYFLSLMMLSVDASIAKMQDDGTQWILPLGSNDGWQMKYIMCDNGEDIPLNDTNGYSWKDLNYDDSSWEILTGPIGSAGIENFTPNFNIIGVDNFFFLRRKFTINGDLADVYCLKIMYDDFVRIYLNGELIIDNNCSTLYIPGSSFVQGENILSICYQGFGYPDYFDYGLYENVDDVIQEDGTFTTITQNGIRMAFKIINEEDKIIQVGSDRGPAIEKRTAGGIYIPAMVNGYNVVKIGEGAFGGCSNITSVLVPEGVTDICTRGFSGCNNLKTISLPSTLRVLGDVVFEDCGNLDNVTIPVGIETIPWGLFFNCRNLGQIEIPNTVKSIGRYAFENCDNLKSVIIPNSVRIIEGMSFRANSLESVICYIEDPFEIEDGTFYGWGTHTDATLYVPIGTLDKYRNTAGWEQFLNIVEMNEVEPEKCEPYAVYKDGVLTFYYDDKKGTREGMVYELNKGHNVPGWYTDHRTNITKAVFDNSFAGARPTNTNGWFAVGYNETSNLKEIKGIQNLNTSNVTNMEHMFYGCSNLTSLDVSHFDTRNVTSMYFMFYGCKGLTSLDVSHFDTGNVTNMGFMFYDCSSLTSLDVSYFDTRSVTGMFDMFEGCSGLTSLDVSHFDTGNVTNMEYMFKGCRSLTSLDVSHFDTGNITSMSYMFYGCSGLSSLDVSHFDTSNVTNMGSMFMGCSSLISLEVSQFDTDNVTRMDYMFQGCSGLTSLDLSHFHTGNVTNMEAMFWRCSGLTNLDVSNFDTRKVTNMDYMFYGCSVLSTIYCNDTWTCSSSTSMFYNCTSLPGYNSANITVDYAKPIDLGGYFARAENNPNGIIDFADAEVKRICVENWDTNGDGELSYGEAAAVEDIGEVFRHNRNIEKFEELRFFIGISNISDYAFYGCSKLMTIIIPNQVIKIGRVSFWSTGLTSIYIPANVTEGMQSNAFYDCDKLASIVVDENNPIFDSRNNCNAIILTSSNKLITGSLNTIIPNDIKIIGANAFSIDGLSNIDIPQSVTSIDYEAFSASGLKSITIPSSVTFLNGNVFARCIKLESISVNTENPVYDSRNNCNAIIETLSNKLIAGCTNTTIPNEIVSIGNGAFDYCRELQSIFIPNKVETIGEDAFRSSGITSISIPKSVNKIGSRAFQWCHNMESVTVNWAVPIAINEDVFSTRARTTLYVPYGCKAAYEAADYWKEFKEIIEMDGENSLYANDVTVRPGNNKTIALQLDNENTFVAGEFRLQLPAGMRIETDEDGDPVANLVSGRSNKHTLMVTDEGNGVYHFLLYSGQNRAILGNSGDFISLSVIADEGVDDGSYTAKLKNVFFSTEDEKRIDLPDVSFNINVLDYTPGDVNGDGSLNVMDVVKLVNYIMGRNPSDFVFAAADMDENDKINVMDLVNVVDIIMSTPQYAPAKSNNMASFSRLILDKTDKNIISMSVPEADRHIAAQFVVTLKGNAVLNDVLSDNDHQSEVTRMSDGRYKVMVYSGKNDVFKNNRPISLQLSGNSDVMIEDVVFVDSDEEAVVYEPAMTNTTGIMAIDTEFSQPTDIYTVGGSLVKKNATSMHGLASGVYIVNNEKVVIK